MDIKHRIISFHPETGSIQVNYYCDEVPDGLTYTIDIPVQDGQFASQDLIDNLIQTFEPRGQLQRIAEVASASIPDHLSQYIQAPVVTDPNAGIPDLKQLSIDIQAAMAEGKTVLNGSPISQDTISLIQS